MPINADRIANRIELDEIRLEIMAIRLNGISIGEELLPHSLWFQQPIPG